MLPLSHPPEKYQSVVCNSVLHDEEGDAANLLI